MSFINQSATLNVKSELDIFSTPPIQTTIESGSLQSYRPITSLSNNGPIEFVISGSSADEYLDLGRVFLYIKAKIRQDPAPEPEAGENAIIQRLGPVNNFMHSMFSQVDIYLNQKCVTPPSNCYMYRAYIENLLNYGAEAKTTHLSTAIFAEDTAGFMESTEETNMGFTQRYATTNGKTFDLYAPLHCDLFNVDKYLINGVEMTVKLQRARNDFCLVGTVDTTGDLDIIDAVLYARKVKISSSTLLAHHKALNVASAKYPINRVDVKTITIPATTRSRSLDNIYIGTLPKRSPSSFTTTPPPESTVDPFAIAVRPRIDTISDVQPYNDTNITWTSGSSDSSDSMSYSLFFGSCVMLAILIYFVRWIRKWRHRRIRYSIPRPIRLASLDTLENGTVSSTCETPTHRQAMEYTAMDSWRHRRTRYSIPRTIDFNSLDTLEHGTANELEHETGFDLDLDETLPSNCETTTPSLPPRRQPIRLEYVEPESIRETDTYPYGYVDLTASTSFVPLQSRSLLMKDIRERDGRI